MYFYGFEIDIIIRFSADLVHGEVKQFLNDDNFCIGVYGERKCQKEEIITA